MKLEYLKLDLHSKLEFPELEFQKSGILLLIGMLLIISAISGKWPISPTFQSLKMRTIIDVLRVFN